jgi:arginyl-tRNA synthetase
MNLLHLLQNQFRTALAGLVPDATPYVEMVKPSQAGRFGDYQANCAMPLQKVLDKKPRDIATDLVARLPLGDMLEPPEIAGPGFINLRFRNDWLARSLQQIARDERLGVPTASPAKTIVIDYSSPNVAKPMHVGHLRSTIIGDALDRLLKFLGHGVISDNHLGDWGTQFGILIYGFKNNRDDAALQKDPVREMVRIYILVRDQIKNAGGGEDEEEAVNPIAEACRQETAKLHAGDPENVALWKRMMPWCQAELDKIYQRLDVHFDYTHGESFYNAMLPGVVADLQAKGLAEISDGAMVVFHTHEVDEKGKLKQPPSLVRKRDGAFTYTTSDLATIQYRLKHFDPDVILYVVDFRQASHFQPLFAIARRWGVDRVGLQHISFGSVLGEDRKPIKTREGGAIELEHLLDEAVQRARKIVDENSPQLSEEERQQVAEAVGIGAVKYADLSQNRTSDYVFSWDKMLAMNGNTATYMQYAYARVRSIFRKGNADPATLRVDPPLPSLETPEERALALALLRFPEATEAAAAEYLPHAITSYLWDLANTYSGFFQNCPVLKAETPALRQSRLLLCDLTARVLEKGLALLGIRTLERM